MQRPLKVLINAQLIPGKPGGTEQFLTSLVYALGRLTQSNEEYILITHAHHPDWLKPLLGPNQRIVLGPEPQAERLGRAKQWLGPLRRPASNLYYGLRQLVSRGPRQDSEALPQSGGFYDSLGGEVIHFPYQEFTRSRLPAIFNPHDLQHLHYPQFFSRGAIALRETVYQAACREAQAVATPSVAVKADLEEQYGLDTQKIFVIHYGAPSALYGDLTDGILHEVREKFRLPSSFAFFPAQTWPHKNHLRLLEALRLVRDREGRRLNLVCSGAKNDHWPAIQRRVDKLGLQEQVAFLGYISPLELLALYHLAEFVVFPSLFEGGGFPVIEALQEGVAVACSDLPSLQEYGGEAVLKFDPQSVESIATCLLRISQDEGLREHLRTRGKERVCRFTWERTARTYRALYRKVGGVSLSKEDLDLLSTNKVC